jgi:uncharacterized membrane protein
MAPRDNVTPFRRPPRRPPVQQSGGGLGLTTHRGKAVTAQALTLAAFIASFFLNVGPAAYLGMIFGVAGAAIAASNREEAMPWARTHHEHALRTLIFGAVIWTLLTLPSLFGGLFAGLSIYIFYARIAVVIWASLRAGIGLVLAILRKPIPHPHGVLI